ncbi:MAG: glutamate 5-kinase [Schwartzia sp.]|nr:glutamate 5-kinase [Schwartzia sp. (in: firmicutes)]
MNIRDGLKEAKRVVVKVGTSTITRENGASNLARMEEIVREIAGLADEGREMVLVTSGAIAAGMNRMGLSVRPKGVPERQALAAVGQGVLMHLYETMFASYGQTAGQVLLTKENSLRHNQYTNSRNALLSMISMGVIPVVNENDAVSVDELKIGDNDTLSATVASLVDADALIILSDVEGLYTANPQEKPDAKLIPEVREITPEIEELAGGAGTAGGTGGMVTKLAAAKIAMSAGVTMVIARGDRVGIMREVLAGEAVGTVFRAKDAHLRARKAWLAFGRHIGGNLTVDEGCVEAMRSGASLLAAGIKTVDGDFSEKSTVRVLGPDGREIARGIVNYGAEDLRRIAGKSTKEIIELLPKAAHDEVIHRDDLVMMV